MISLLIGALAGIVITAIVFAVIIWRMPDELDMGSLTSKLNIIKNGIESERMKRMQIRSQTLEEIRSLRRMLVTSEREEEDEYHRALSKSTLATARKLAALVERLGLEYVPAKKDVYQKAHFKEKKK